MNRVDLLRFLPLTVFIIFARLNGMTDLAWRDAFILGGISTIIVVAVQLYKKVTFDRLMLGVNLFLLAGAAAFLGNMYSLLYLYGKYKGAALLAWVGLVGLITTFCMPAGFIGAYASGKEKLIKKQSSILLLINVALIIWAIVMYQYGLIISGIVPFIVLRFAYEELGKSVK